MRHALLRFVPLVLVAVTENVPAVAATGPGFVLVCPKCAGPRRVLAAIHDPAAIARVLAALGRTAAGADPSGCRAPPAAAGDAADEGDAAE